MKDDLLFATIPTQNPQVYYANNVSCVDIEIQWCKTEDKKIPQLDYTAVFQSDNIHQWSQL